MEPGTPILRPSLWTDHLPAGAPTPRTSGHQHDRRGREEREIALRDPTVLTADQMRKEVERRTHANAQEGDGQRVGARGGAAKQEHGSEADLECTDVLDKVLVVGLK